MEQVDGFLQECAIAIRERRLAVPAIFLLELYKPFANLVRESLRVIAPFMLPCVGAGRTERLISLLDDRHNIEKLLCLLEADIPAAKEKR